MEITLHTTTRNGRSGLPALRRLSLYGLVRAPKLSTDANGEPDLETPKTIGRKFRLKFEVCLRGRALNDVGPSRAGGIKVAFLSGSKEALADL